MATMRSKIPLLFVLSAAFFFCSFAQEDWSQGSQQQLQRCQFRCVSQGQTPQQCQRSCIQQLSGSGSGSQSLGPYQLDAVVDQGSWGRGGQQSRGQAGQQQQLQQCQLRCMSQGQTPQQCQRSCIQQLSGGGSGSQSLGPYQLDDVVDQGSWGQGGQQSRGQAGQQQQLQQCQLRCMSQGQTPQQCQRSCIQQLSGSSTIGGGSLPYSQFDSVVEQAGRGQGGQQQQQFQQCQRYCRSQAQSPMQEGECQSRCMQQGRGGSGGFMPSDGQQQQYSQCQQYCEGQQGQSRIQCQRRCEQQTQQGGGRGGYGGRGSRGMFGFSLED